MKPRSAILYAGSLWQIVRFACLTLFMLLVIYPESAPAFVALIIWPTISQLPLSIAFFLLALRLEKYREFRRLLILAKILDTVPGMFIILYQARSVFFGLGEPLVSIAPALDLITGGPSQSAVIFYYALVGVVLFDLLFLFVLISLRLAPEDDAPEITSNLPEMSEIQLEDE